MGDKRESPTPSSSQQQQPAECKERQTKFSDKERIRLEEEGLCEDDFKPISVNPDDQVECPELLKSQGESCWDSKQLVTLADLGNWTDDLSPERQENSVEKEKETSTPVQATSLKQKIKRPMKRKKKKTIESTECKQAKQS